MDLFKLRAVLGLDTQDFEKGINKGYGIINSFGQTVSAKTVAMGNLMSDAVKKGISFITDMGKTGIEYNAQIQDFTSRLTTVMGDANAAAEKMEFLKEYANKTPFELPGLAEATTRLLQFGTTTEDVDSVLQMLGDVSLGNAQAFERLTYTFSQVRNVGKMTKEDFNQLAEAGFNPLKEIAEETGASMDDLMAVMSGGKTSRNFRNMIKAAQKEVKKMGDGASDSAKMLAQIGKEGMISADMLQKAFELATEEGGTFYKGMDNAAKTYSGLFSTLIGSFADLRGKVFQPVSDFLTQKLLPQAIAWVDRISEAYDVGGLSGALTESGKIISNLAKGLLENAPGAFADAAEAIVLSITGSINAAFGTGIEIPFDVSDIVTSGIENTLSFVTDALTWISENGGTVATLVGGIATAMGLLAISANPIGAAVSAIGIGIAAIITHWDEFKKSDVGQGLGTLVENFSSIAKDIGAANTELATMAATKFDESFLPAIQSLMDYWSGIAANVSSAYDSFALFVATKFEALFLSDTSLVKTTFSDIADFISDAWTNLTSFTGITVPKGLLNAFETIKSTWDSISSAISSAVSNILQFIGLRDDADFGGGSSSGSGAGSSFAVGKDYVPYDNYAANLHRGEAVLTRSEAEDWRSGKTQRPSITVIQNIYSEAKTAADLMEEARWAQERAILGYV